MTCTHFFCKLFAKRAFCSAMSDEMRWRTSPEERVDQEIVNWRSGVWRSGVQTVLSSWFKLQRLWAHLGESSEDSSYRLAAKSANDAIRLSLDGVNNGQKNKKQRKIINFANHLANHSSFSAGKWQIMWQKLINESIERPVWSFAY